MEHEKFTKPNRLTEVLSSGIQKMQIGDLLVPKLEQLKEMRFMDDFSNAKEGDPIWRLWVHERTGLDHEEWVFFWFASRAAAEELAKVYRTGFRYGDGRGWLTRFKDSFPSGKELSTLRGMFAAPHDNFGMKNLDILKEVGVIDAAGNTSEAVENWLGEDGLNWLQNNIGGDNAVVGQFEFCLHHFPKSSLAYMAAWCELARHVTRDEYTVGYLTKEIELILGGAEAVASEAIAVRERAGAGGGQSSHDRKMANLELVMTEIEDLKDLVGRISEDRLVEQALDSARAKNENMPTSSKSLQRYETILRSEEPFKSRYDAVFGRNA